MKVKVVDILSNDVLKDADAVCFTSNGIIRKNGALVMGAGVAKAFRDKINGLDVQAGNCVKLFGNVCQRVGFYIWRDSDGKPQQVSLVAFPTKHHWKNPSDLGLISKSAHELVDLADKHEWSNVYLPAPGCSNGKLSFATQVKPIIEKILDDRFIITFLPRGNI